MMTRNAGAVAGSPPDVTVFAPAGRVGLQSAPQAGEGNRPERETLSAFAPPCCCTDNGIGFLFKSWHVEGC